MEWPRRLTIEKWIEDYYSDKGDDFVLESIDIDQVLNLVKSAPNQGAYQVFTGVRRFSGSLLKVSTLTFQEESTLLIEAGDRDLIVIAANEVLFDAPQLRLEIRLTHRTSRDGVPGATIEALPQAVRPKGERHGPHGADGRTGNPGGHGEDRTAPTVIFIFGSMAVRSGTIDKELLDATLVFNGVQGGHGANGGTGQNGQQGAKGRDASWSGFKCRHAAGSGGNGGSGGLGGPAGEGGDGADGADLIFYGPDESLSLLKFFNTINEGASGGRPGSPGGGGSGGKFGGWGKRRTGCGRGSTSGSVGPDGDEGRRGNFGAAGKSGSLAYLDDNDRAVDTLF